MFQKGSFTWCSTLAVVAIVIFLQISEGSAMSSKLAGKYIYDTNPYDKSVHKLLLEYGFELIDMETVHHLAPERTKEIVCVEQDIVQITDVTKDGSHTQQFISGREVDEPYLLEKPEYVARTTATVEGDKDKITFKRRLARKRDQEMMEIFECHDDGCTSTLSYGKGANVTVHWKRMN